MKASNVYMRHSYWPYYFHLQLNGPVVYHATGEEPWWHSYVVLPRYPEYPRGPIIGDPQEPPDVP